MIDPDYRPNLLQALRKTPYHPFHQLQMMSNANGLPPPTSTLTSKDDKLVPNNKFFSLHFFIDFIFHKKICKLIDDLYVIIFHSNINSSLGLLVNYLSLLILLITSN